MTDEQIIKAWDILAKLDFFGGQRAGRELWNSKPVDVQNEDIENFSKDIAFLKDFINRQDAEVERKTTECERLEIYMDELVKQKLNQAKAESIKEFAERLKQCGRYPQCRPFPDNPVLKQNRIWLEEDIDSLVNYESSKMTE